MKRFTFTAAAVLGILFLVTSCGASRAEKERKAKEKMDKLDEDKKRFEQQNPGNR